MNEERIATEGWSWIDLRGQVMKTPDDVAGVLRLRACGWGQFCMTQRGQFRTRFDTCLKTQNLSSDVAMCELGYRLSRPSKDNLLPSVVCGVKGLNMNWSVEVRTHRLLQISTNLHNRMAEVRKLREMVRSAEAAKLGQEPIHPAAVAHPVDNKLYV